MTELSEAELANAFAGVSAPKTPSSAEYEFETDVGVALKMRGLPYQVTNDDIKAFFAGYKISDNKIKIGTNPDGSKTGEGSVLFNSEEDARKAYKECQGRNIGHRYIELFIMCYGDFMEFEKI